MGKNVSRIQLRNGVKSLLFLHLICTLNAKAAFFTAAVHLSTKDDICKGVIAFLFGNTKSLGDTSN